MKKFERILITVALLVLACFLMWPTLKWYSLTSSEDRSIATSGIEGIRNTAHRMALDDTAAIKAYLDSDEAIDREFKMQVGKAKDTYNRKGKPQPSKWTAKAILDAYDSESEAVYSFESYYRDKYLGLNKTSKKALKLGLDLRGGMSVLLDGDVSSLEARLGHSPSSEEISNALDQDIEILRLRIDQYGVSEADIRRQGNDQILVEVPGEVDPSRVESFLRGQGDLKFAIVDNAKTEELITWANEHYSELFDENGAFVAPSWIPEGYKAVGYYQNDEYGLDALVGFVVIDESETMDGSYIVSVETARDNISNRPVVNFRLNNEGGDRFYDITSRHVNDRLAVVLDGKAKSVATINDALRTNVQVSGFTEQQAEDLSLVLKSTSFPIDLTVASEERVGASLGEDAIALSIKAFAVGLAIIVVFMLAYYWLQGLLSVFMLAINMFLIVSVLSAFSFTLTLTSIAGLILTLGMSVDSSIIIFERIREEIALGKPEKEAVRLAYSKAKWTLLDANITTMIAAIVLSFLGSSAVKGFANTLAVGIVCTLITMLFISHLCEDIFVVDRKHGRVFIGKVRRLSSEEINSENGTLKHILPVQKGAKFALCISTAFFILGAVFFGVKGGFNLGIDFESGYVATVQVDQTNRDTVRIDEVRSALGDSSFTVQNRGDSDNGMFIVKAPASDEEARSRVSETIINRLNDTFGAENVGIISETFIGAKFSSSLVTGSILGILVSLALILVYIWIRFRLSYALAAVLSLMHDVILLLAFITISRIEISSVTIAAILTIIGYSLNNTIVIFDRVRENIKLSLGKGDINRIIDRSVTQSLKRTLFSSFTTIAAVLPIAIFVTSEIRMFAICLTCGILIGIYSANFVSPNILRLFTRIKKSAFDITKVKVKNEN